LKKFNDSPSLVISSIYPEYDWLPWKFTMCPRNYWDDMKNQRKFMDWAGKQLNVQETNDWLKIQHQDFCEIGGTSLLMKYRNSMSRLLTEVYPKHNWNVENSSPQKSMSPSVKKSQFLLKTYLKELFPKEGNTLRL
jgi:hypothetical protein